MAQIQMPPTASQIMDGEEQEQLQQQQSQERSHQVRQHEEAIDDSWVCTPPGGPQFLEKQNAMDLDTTIGEISPPAPSKQARPSHGFAMDDLEAAETLAGFARQSSPPAINTTPAVLFPPYHPPTAQAQPEPLLSLLTSQHPLIGSAINGSLSAYNFGKSYSSQFRYGADFVERNIASPVASTVGTAGRITGVENGVRRWLSRGRVQQTNGDTPQVEPQAGPSAVMMSPSSSNASQKRRRDDSEPDFDQGKPAQRSRAGSEISLSQGEYLPAYDANRSPTYSSRDPYPPHPPQQHHLGNSTWQTRLILSTSGLGVAMSGESRRSLKYCLRWLRWANGRLGRLVFSLQSLLAEYDAAVYQRNGSSSSDNSAAAGQQPRLQPRDQAAITAQLAAIRAECEKVLKKAVDVVSNYTGGALPDNARALVHRHLTSLPQRFAIALRGENDSLIGDEEAANGDKTLHLESAVSPTPHGSIESSMQMNVSEEEKSEVEKRRDAVRAAKRMVVLAREGLEMMGQVSLVVDSTITSAEEWCNRLGRRIPEDGESVGGEQEPGQPDSTPPQEQMEPANGVSGEQRLSEANGVSKGTKSDQMDVEQSHV